MGHWQEQMEGCWKDRTDGKEGGPPKEIRYTYYKQMWAFGYQDCYVFRTGSDAAYPFLALTKVQHAGAGSGTSDGASSKAGLPYFELLYANAADGDILEEYKSILMVAPLDDGSLTAALGINSCLQKPSADCIISVDGRSIS